MKHSTSPADESAGTDEAAQDGKFADATNTNSKHRTSIEEPQASAEEPQAPETPTKPKKKHHALLAKIKAVPKKWLVLGTVGLLAVIAAILLFTPLGYPVVGGYFTQDVQVNASDDTFRLNVTDISIELDGEKQEFKGEGPFVLKRVKAGKHSLKITRQYYEDHTVDFTIQPLSKRSQALSFNASLKPTGRPVLVTVTDTISGKAVEGASVKFEKAEATTNNEGVATVVLPSSANTGDIEVNKDSYNKVSATIKADTPDANKVTITQAGRVYFLSKRTGNIDLYSSNLDGSDAKVELAATGNETDDMSLYVSPNRRWLAFRSSRDGTRSAVNKELLSKVFVFDTTNGKVTAADEGDASFTMLGWTNSNKLVYYLDKHIAEYNKPPADKYRIKSYNPEDGQLKVLYSSKISEPNQQTNYLDPGYYGSKESLGTVWLTDNYLIYSFSRETYDYMWYTNDFNRSFVIVADMDGKMIRQVEKVGYLSMHRMFSDHAFSFNANGATLDFDIKANKESEAQPHDPPKRPEGEPAPGNQKKAWSEGRDGQSVTFVSDIDGKNEKQIAARQGLDFLEWYNDDYILMLSTHDEYALYIIAADGGEPVKISNIHSYTSYHHGY